MIIGFAGASGRTDASHCALLVVHALRSLGKPVTLLVVGDGTPPVVDAALRVIEVAEGTGAPEAALRAAVAACVSEGGTIVADLPRRMLGLAGIHPLLHVAVAVVGPHRSDERVAAAAAGQGGPAPWHLGCRRGGGAPAAARFAAEMRRLAPGIRTLPLVLAPLGRAEAAGLEGSATAARPLRSGLRLLAALRQAFEGASPPGGATPEDPRVAPTTDAGSLPDRLRDLADDIEAAEAGLAPDPAELADAPILDGWSIDAIPTPVLKGRVTGHPGIVDGHRARTSEVYMTDRATYARTLSRWYRLRTREGCAPRGLQ